LRSLLGLCKSHPRHCRHHRGPCAGGRAVALSCCPTSAHMPQQEVHRVSLTIVEAHHRLRLGVARGRHARRRPPMGRTCVCSPLSATYGPFRSSLLGQLLHLGKASVQHRRRRRRKRGIARGDLPKEVKDHIAVWWLWLSAGSKGHSPRARHRGGRRRHHGLRGMRVMRSRGRQALRVEWPPGWG